jgi:vancomycin aglycone glucosyltransferase
MRVLLSTIGSRGDVQLILALAVKLQELGHKARVCAPPDFRELVEGYGISFVPVGQEVRPTASRPRDTQPPITEKIRQIMEETITGQFVVTSKAARDCDVLVAGMSLQFAMRSVAESMKVPYIYAAWCPVTLPSPHHAPPPLPSLNFDGTSDNLTLWARDARRWNANFGRPLNITRASRGLEEIPDVQRHIFTDRPWLAADPVLAPWIKTDDLDVVQTGAWLLKDDRQLSSEVEAFLNAGEPPVYFGFSSMSAPQDLSWAMVAAARANSCRAIVSRGWADVALPDNEPDCLSVGEENLQALFKRVAAVVHHGGAGTTTIAAQAGTAQVIVPQIWDQHYWAKRVQELGIGIAHAPGAPSADSLSAALRQALLPDVAVRARSIANAVRSDGAEVAARRLIHEVKGSDHSIP